MEVSKLLKEDNLLFYDIEVFKEDALVVFKDINKKVVKIYHNTFEGILETIRDKTLVGFNNYFYDDHILTVMINQWTPYQIKKQNDRIIGGERIRASSIHSEIFSLDCFQQADVSMPSLKKIEANMGVSIYESKIDFTIDRKLTEPELEETIAYCSYDVDETIDIYKQRIGSYFEPKLNVIKMMDKSLQLKAVRWNTTTIAAHVLTGGKPIAKWSDIRLGEYNKEGEYELFNILPPEVVNFFKANYKTGKGKYVLQEFGCNIEFGFGGLHGTPIVEMGKYKNVKLLDVESLYPNIILKLLVLAGYSERYARILVERIKVKNTDKTLSGALKLILNSAYGLLRSQYSLLYNPMGAVSVCIYGQIILYDLCKRLADTCTLININTDGVAFTTDSEDYKRVWKEWESDYSFKLEEETYATLIQKDVNNYIGIEPNGKIKVKGADIGRYLKPNIFKNCSKVIVDVAVAEKLINDTDPLDTILDNLDKPELFQIVLQAGHTYKGTYDMDDNKYQKVNRVFPIKKGGVRLYKKRQDDGMVLFPDAPENMMVWNGEVADIENFGSKIDINFYYTLINKVLERWETV